MDLLKFNDQLQRPGFRSTAKGVVSNEYLIELEAVRDQSRRVDFFRLHRLQQHRLGDGINEACRDRYVL